MFFQPKTLEFWATKELSLVRRKFELQAGLEGAEAAAGEAMLDEDPATNPAVSFEAVERTRGELRGVDAAIRACRLRRREVIHREREENASKLRKQAAEKSRELESLESKVGRLLEQIRELEGCAYQPAATPATSLLRADADRLERAAWDIEQVPVLRSGDIDLDSVVADDEVLLAVAMHPSDAPSIEEVLNWLAACEQSAKQYRAATFGTHQRRVRLVWNADGIDHQQSTIFCAALAKRIASEGDQDFIDVGSGTFRSALPTVATRGPMPVAEAQPRSGWYRG